MKPQARDPFVLLLGLGIHTVSKGRISILNNSHWIRIYIFKRQCTLKVVQLTASHPIPSGLIHRDYTQVRSLRQPELEEVASEQAWESCWPSRVCMVGLGLFLDQPQNCQLHPKEVSTGDVIGHLMFTRPLFQNKDGLAM